MTTPITETTSATWPLSSAQNRFWFMEHMETGISANNNPLDYRIIGDLDKHILEESLKYLVRRHEALRTVFPNGTGDPSQLVLDDLNVILHTTDLSGETPERREELVQKHARDNAGRKFNFSEGPLFHFELLELGNREYVFLLNFHHIVTDAGSIDLFLAELKTVYNALSGKTPVDLPAISYTYKEYALRESQWLGSDGYIDKLDYWKKELAEAPDFLNLPYDLPRPRIQNFKGDEFHFSIGPAQRTQMGELSRRRGTSLPAFLLAAFGVLLNRYSMQDDIVVGMPFANRNEEELLQLFGVLINTIPVRIPVNGTDSFHELLGKVRGKVLHAYDNMEVPFERLVDELKVKRTPNVNPVFQVLYNYLAENHREISLPGATMNLWYGSRKFSQFDLSLTIHDERDHLHCVLQYNTELFLPTTISRLAGHFLTILETVTASDTVQVSRIPLLTSDESKLMTELWNDTAAPYPKDLCIHQMFEEQAARTPDRIALEDLNGQLSYRELNERANRLAHYLAKAGVGEDTVASIFLERTSDLVISILAVSKTGATYLPLDPIFPKDRLESILLDASPVVLITQESLTGSLPATGTQTILIDGDLDLKDMPVTNPGMGNASKTAYILYTSGSTGKPKGVPIRHHSVVNLVMAFTRLLSVSPEDVLLAVTTVSFDIAELELLLPLFNGAKLVVAPQEAAMDMELLRKMFREGGITLFQATPVTFKMLLKTGWPGDRKLKVLVGGEAFSKDLAKDLVGICGEVWNCYGPTETTIWSSVKRLVPEDADGEGSVSIGKPIANNTFYVLSSGMVPVPVGIPGELYIGGDGVSDGYLHLPELNAERFVPNPFGKGRSEKLYRTGDLVRYQPDGNLVFLNRSDSQVKIRGFRIELGEIETVLSRCAGIHENVVMVCADGSGNNILAAYYTREGEAVVDHQILRQSMKTKLPDYMIPTIFIEMEKMPLTTNNKIDRKELPKPETVTAPLAANYVPPSTPTEISLAKIWEDILNVDRVGINDDFFDVGGHSMVAVTMIRKIEKDFGVRLPLAMLFDRNTIRRLAELIDEGATQVQWRSLVPIRPAGSKKPLFLVHGMGLNVLLYTTVISHLDPDQPVYGLQAKGLNGTDEPLQSVEEIAAYYISEIMSVDSEGPYALAGFSFGGRIAFEMAQQLTSMGKQVGFLGLFDATAEESFGHLPLIESYKRRLLYLFNYFKWNLSGFFFDKNESKMDFLRRRWRGLKNKTMGMDFNAQVADLKSEGTSGELPGYLRRVHRANRRADRKYVVRPYNGPVHLFKAQKQTFYLSDPETYGWDKVALGGVLIHEIPGEHSNTFAPPNDKIFATALQRNLNESI